MCSRENRKLTFRLLGRRKGFTAAGERALRRHAGVLKRRNSDCANEGNRTSRLPVGRFRIALLLSCAALLAVPASMAATSTGAGAAISPLKQGLNFYQGKIITFIVPSAAGSEFDVATRIVVPFIENYLHATIEVHDIATGASITGQDTLAGSSPNGLTIGIFETASDISNLIQNLPGLNFNPEHEVMLGGPTNSATLLVASPNSPYKNFRDLQRDTSSDPARLLLQSTSRSNILVRLFLKAFGVKANFVYGFTSSVSIEQGFLNGDGTLDILPITTNEPLVQGGKATAIYQDFKPPKGAPYYSLLAGVPDMAQVATKYAGTTPLAKRALSLWKAFNTNSSVAIGGPARISSSKVVALRAAIQYAFTRPVVTKDFIQQGAPTGYTSGPTEKAGYVSNLTLVKPISSLLGY